MFETSPEKEPKEIAQEAVEIFFEAYQDKYKEDGESNKDSEEITKKHIAMFESGDYSTLKDFLNKALHKYTTIQKRMYETGPVEKDSTEEKAIIEYENMTEKTKVAIKALEALE